MKRIKDTITAEKAAQLFSLLLLALNLKFAYDLVYYSIVPGHVDEAIQADFYWACSFLVYCFIQARWIPQSNAKHCGLVAGISNPFGSFLLGAYILDGCYRLLSKGVPLELSPLLGLGVGISFGICLHIWVATGVFWLVRRKWPKEQEAADETDRA